MDTPTIAITMGDPAGIGPELVAKVFADTSVYGRCRPLVIGDVAVMKRTCRALGVSLEVVAAGNSLAEAGLHPGRLDVLCPAELHLGAFAIGVVDPAMGRAAALCLRTAYELAAAGAVQGVVMAPMNKEAFHLAGYAYMDELAYLADLTASPDCSIVGVVTPALWTIAVTEHIPFRAIADLLTTDRILKRTRALHDVLIRVGFARPRLAVAALNVHGGEGGMFGREELDQIAPAVRQAASEGMQVTGPWPADTVFVRAREGEFDGVVSMYHDQANIARKLLATRKGATLYLGLPVVCGTTAHGTAFDKAGKGIAEPGSLQEALNYTIMLAR